MVMPVIVCGIQQAGDMNNFLLGARNTIGHVVEDIVCLLNDATHLLATREKCIRKTWELDDVQFRRQQLRSQHLFAKPRGGGGLEDFPCFPFRIDLCLRITVPSPNSKEDR